ncbi:polysaccharide deacetylase family protein [Neobacillus sp. SM06]|uniref:polysaccharide deacetylase family protein n=1 Tax=Neobacillus sp. SM06 TaxID=3422492 RepID=UPI003D2E90D3
MIKKEPMIFTHGNRTVPKIAVTFDGGSTDFQTERILRILQKTEAKSIFFLTGEFIDHYPELTKRMVQDGHEIGNHSNPHPDFTKLSTDEMIKEIALCEEKIFRTTGITPRPLFRQPYGYYNQKVLNAVHQAGYRSILWSLDSRDWKQRKTNYLVHKIVGKAENGDIVLFHLNSKNTPEALEIILPLLKNKFQLVTIKVLLGL